VGDVRPPLTTFASLGEEGQERLGRLKEIMGRLDALIDELDAVGAAA
jgi:4-hydroxy-tetrahydrodipicolinate synthase